MHTTLAFAPTKEDLPAADFDLPAQQAIPDMPNNPSPEPRDVTRNSTPLQWPERRKRPRPRHLPKAQARLRLTHAA